MDRTPCGVNSASRTFPRCRPTRWASMSVRGVGSIQRRPKRSDRRRPLRRRQGSKNRNWASRGLRCLPELPSRHHLTTLGNWRSNSVTSRESWPRSHPKRRRLRLPAKPCGSIRGTPRPGKGDRHLLPERPFGCFAQKVPVPLFPAVPSEIAAGPGGVAHGCLARVADRPDGYGLRRGALRLVADRRTARSLADRPAHRPGRSNRPGNGVRLADGSALERSQSHVGQARPHGRASGRPQEYNRPARHDPQHAGHELLLPPGRGAPIRNSYWPI